MGDYLQQVEEQLVELTEQGAHRRPRPRLDLLAVGAAVAVVAAVAVAVSTIGQNVQRHTASHSHHATVISPTKRQHSIAHHRTGTITKTVVNLAVPPGGPVPAGFGAESFTALDEFNWWLLGNAPCSSPPCTSIVRTGNGGRSFVGIPAPRTDQVSQLRFADPSDGFAYGPELWVTHGGGFGWHPIRTSGQVTELAAGGGYVYAIVRSPNGGGSLVRAPANSDSWKLLPAAGSALSGLWVHGSNVLLESANNSRQSLMISTDFGGHFTAEPLPPDVACQLEMPAPPVIWEHCATGMMSGIWRSVNDGRTYTPAGRGAPELPNSAAFGSASPVTAVVGYRQLYRTGDGGLTWTPSSGPRGITGWQYLGFTDATHGVAIGYVGNLGQASNERLYYTTDGGASYHLVRVR